MVAHWNHQVQQRLICFFDQSACVGVLQGREQTSAERSNFFAIGSPPAGDGSKFFCGQAVTATGDALVSPHSSASPLCLLLCVLCACVRGLPPCVTARWLERRSRSVRLRLQRRASGSRRKHTTQEESDLGALYSRPYVDAVPLHTVLAVRFFLLLSAALRTALRLSCQPAANHAAEASAHCTQHRHDHATGIGHVERCCHRCSCCSCKLAGFAHSAHRCCVCRLAATADDRCTPAATAIPHEWRAVIIARVLANAQRDRILHSVDSGRHSSPNPFRLSSRHGRQGRSAPPSLNSVL
jgi:hypothetical protein